MFLWVVVIVVLQLFKVKKNQQPGKHGTLSSWQRGDGGPGAAAAKVLTLATLNDVCLECGRRFETLWFYGSIG